MMKHINDLKNHLHVIDKHQKILFFKKRIRRKPSLYGFKSTLKLVFSGRIFLRFEKKFFEKKTIEDVKPLFLLLR
jgi:hypothetical protein